MSSVNALRWVPDSHTLLLLGESSDLHFLQRLEVDTDMPSAPCEQHDGLPGRLVMDVSPVAGFSAMQPACLDVLPSGAAAVVLSSRQSEDSAELYLMLYSLHERMQRLSELGVALDADEGVVAVHTSVHASARAIAACSSYGTSVCSLDGVELGSWLFHTPGLESVCWSKDACFLAGVMDNSHVVLDARDGSCLYTSRMPALQMEALSIAWAGLGHNQLQLYLCSYSEEDGDATLQYEIVDF